MAIPFKKQVFCALKKVWVPPSKISRHLYFNGVFTVDVGERHYSVNHYGFDVETSIFWYGLTGAWEKISMSAWIALCEEAKVIVDIGANTGAYSLVAKALSPGSLVYSFEPVKRVFEKLVANNRLNHYDTACQQSAVSNYDGEGIVYDLPTEHIYSVTLNKNMHSRHLIAAAQPTMVRVTRLDTFMSAVGLKHIDLVKIDVESHEPEVLEGMGAYLSSIPALLLEVWNNDVGRRIEQIVGEYDYLYFRTDEIQPFYPTEHIEKPGPSGGYVNYLLCTPQIASHLGLI
jgi:FkbM family methyltransferase